MFVPTLTAAVALLAWSFYAFIFHFTLILGILAPPLVVLVLRIIHAFRAPPALLAILAILKPIASLALIIAMLARGKIGVVGAYGDALRFIVTPTRWTDAAVAVSHLIVSHWAVILIHGLVLGAAVFLTSFVMSSFTGSKLFLRLASPDPTVHPDDAAAVLLVRELTSLLLLHPFAIIYLVSVYHTLG